MKGLTAKELRSEIETIAGLSDALCIVCQAQEDQASDVGVRAAGTLAKQISRSLDTLYHDVMEALEEPDSFLGQKRKGRT